MSGRPKRQFGLRPRRIALKLAEHDVFLKININVINELIEYQFTLYNILNTSHKKANITDEYMIRIVNDIEEPISVNNIIINPREDDYKRDVLNVLKQLFPESDSPPVARLYANGKIVENIIYCAIDDTVSLDASFSFDKESTSSNFFYLWSQIEPKIKGSIPDSLLLSLNQGEAKQIITFAKTGGYCLSLRVFDGVQYSDNIFVCIYVIERPLLLPDQSVFDFHGFNVFFWNSNRKNRKHEFSLNSSLYYYTEIEKVRINVEMTSKLSLDAYTKKYYAILQEEKKLDYTKNKYSKILIVDSTVLDKNRIKINSTFTPLYTQRNKQYKFNIQPDYNGVLGNNSQISINFIKYGFSFKLNSFALGSANYAGETTRYLDKAYYLVQTGAPPREEYVVGPQALRMIGESLSFGISGFLVPKMSLEIGLVITPPIFVEKDVKIFSDVGINDTTSYILFTRQWEGASPYLKMSYMLLVEPFWYVESYISVCPISIKKTSLFEATNDNFKDKIPIYLHDDYEELLQKEKLFNDQSSLNESSNQMASLFNVGMKINQRVFRNPLIFIGMGLDFYYFKGRNMWGFGFGLSYYL